MYERQRKKRWQRNSHSTRLSLSAALGACSQQIRLWVQLTLLTLTCSREQHQGRCPGPLSRRPQSQALWDEKGDAEDAGSCAGHRRSASLAGESQSLSLIDRGPGTLTGARGLPSRISARISSGDSAVTAGCRHERARNFVASAQFHPRPHNAMQGA